MNYVRRVVLAAVVAAFYPGYTLADLDTITPPGTGLVWAGCGVTKTAFMAELAAAYEKKAGIAIELKGGGATKGIRDVAKKKINIGGACRTAMEFDADERYVRQIPVAWDAIVFIVHNDNPVNDINIAQIRDIYNGKITNWKQVGGNNETIELYVRESAISGVGQTLRELVFNDYDKKFTNKAHVVKSSGPAEKAVTESPRAFTATGVSSARRQNVKILRVNGVEPTFEHIKNGDYMLYRPLYLVTRMNENNPEVLDFLNFATSPEGKEVIRHTGTVPYADALNLLSKHYLQYLGAISSGL